MTISEKFSQLRDRKERALLLYVTAGDPSLSDLNSILDALIEGGADLIEVGIPFSDPIADGPTIQAASQRALDRGTTPNAVLGELAKRANGDVPIITMGYYNTVSRWGIDGFAAAQKGSGVSGSIVCDLTPEEGGDWIAAAQRFGIDTIFLAAPTSTPERLDAVAAASTGFVYAVSRTGVTGAAQSLPGEVGKLCDDLRNRTQVPICVGFGISAPEHVRAVGEHADGAIVGSYIVDLIATEWNGGTGRQKIVNAVRELKLATKSSG